MPVHENSVKNLKPITSVEMAREYQRRSVESRLARKQALEDFSIISKELKEFSAVDIMRAMLGKAIEEGDQEAIFKYTKELAPYESPKLASQTLDVIDNTKDLSDEELEKAIQELEKE